MDSFTKYDRIPTREDGTSKYKLIDTEQNQTQKKVTKNTEPTPEKILIDETSKGPENR